MRKLLFTVFMYLGHWFSQLAIEIAGDDLEKWVENILQAN